jgi:hypothetical protein
MKARLALTIAAASLIPSPAAAAGPEVYASESECNAVLWDATNWNAAQSYYCAYDIRTGGWVIDKLRRPRNPK